MWPSLAGLGILFERSSRDVHEVGHEPTGAHHLRMQFRHCPTFLMHMSSFHPPAEHLSCILLPTKTGTKTNIRTLHSPLGTMRRAPGPEASRSAGTGGQAMRVVLALLLAARVVIRCIGGACFGKDAELSEDSMCRTFLAAGLWDAQLVIIEDNMQGEAVVLCYLQAQHGACQGGLPGRMGKLLRQETCCFHVSILVSNVARSSRILTHSTLRAWKFPPRQASLDAFGRHVDDDLAGQCGHRREGHAVLGDFVLKPVLPHPRLAWQRQAQQRHVAEDGAGIGGRGGCTAELQ